MKLIKKRAIIFGSLLLILILINQLRRVPGWVEIYYSNGLYPLIARGRILLLGWLPVSVGDLVYLLIVIWLGYFSIRLFIDLFRARYRESAILFITGACKVLAGFNLFYFLWGINYFRDTAPKRMQLPERAYTAVQLQEVAGLLIDSMVSIRAGLEKKDLEVTFKTIAPQSEKDFSRLSGKIISKFTGFSVKSSSLHPIISFLGTAGYFNPITGEAQVNSAMPVHAQPFTALHEIAHQNGTGPEDEANFVAFRAGIRSESRLFRYSAYYSAGKEFMFELWRTDSVAYKNLRGKLSPAILEDMQEEREFWQKYQGSANKLSGIFYDNYLKANMQAGGLKTYNEMIKLTMAFYMDRKKLLE